MNGDDCMKGRALEVQRDAGLTHAFFARAKSTKIFRRPRHNIVVQLKCDSSGWLATDRNIKENLNTGPVCRKILADKS